MLKINKYVEEVETNASKMSVAGRAVYMYKLIDAIYYGSKKAGALQKEKDDIGFFRDNALKYEGPYESRLTHKD